MREGQDSLKYQRFPDLILQRKLGKDYNDLLEILSKTKKKRYEKLLKETKKRIKQFKSTFILFCENNPVMSSVHTSKMAEKLFMESKEGKGFTESLEIIEANLSLLMYHSGKPITFSDPKTNQAPNIVATAIVTNSTSHNMSGEILESELNIDADPKTIFLFLNQFKDLKVKIKPCFDAAFALNLFEASIKKGVNLKLNNSDIDLINLNPNLKVRYLALQMPEMQLALYTAFQKNPNKHMSLGEELPEIAPAIKPTLG